MSNLIECYRNLRDFKPEFDDDVIICRCEEISKGEIRKAVHEGMYTLNMVKRFLRCGMGLCQGMTCEKQIRNIIARELGVSPSEITMATPRSPMRPVIMEVYSHDTYELPKDRGK